MKRYVNIGSPDVTASVFGICDKNALTLEEALGVRLSNEAQDGAKEDTVCIEGENEEEIHKAEVVLSYLRQVVLRGDAVTEQALEYAITLVKDGAEEALETFGADVVCLTHRGKPIKPKTVGQKQYIQAIRKNTVVFGIGPAGTGKTFLAVAMAVDALRKKEVSRIVLTRPAVEAGERLGFLPGDLQSKIDPYLRPLYDALYEMLGAENYQHYVEKNMIEIAPLAYMRGRTLDNSFIILDEAQNTTNEQMKMFLTRLGTESKAVVTGDPSQIDLPDNQKSGLLVATHILKDIAGIAVHTFTGRDVVRHRLVQQIIAAYQKQESKKNEKNHK
ncbi:MAG: PhoH family protein [Clostridia bacterium]|nr:PhoH family protein [Clostridia bacterium]